MMTTHLKRDNEQKMGGGGLGRPTESADASNKKEIIKKEISKTTVQNIEWKETPIGKIRYIKEVKMEEDKIFSILINKWETVLGQTLYIKKIQRKTSNEFDKLSLSSKEFVLNKNSILEILENQNFKKNITIGKTLKIIKELIEDKETIPTISEKYKIDQQYVEMLKYFIR